MSILNENESLILIIDVQEKLLNAIFNNETVLTKAKILSKSAQLLNLPVIVTEQYPKGLGTTLDDIKSQLPSNAIFYEKNYFSALNNQEIAEAISKSNRKQIVILGIETHICVSHTTADLLNMGYDVFVIKDACGSRNETEYIAGLERMKGHGAQIITTEIALFEWLKSSKHLHFKEIQSLIK